MSFAHPLPIGFVFFWKLPPLVSPRLLALMIISLFSLLCQCHLQWWLTFVQIGLKLGQQLRRRACGIAAGWQSEDRSCQPRFNWPGLTNHLLKAENSACWAVSSPMNYHSTLVGAPFAGWSARMLRAVQRSTKLELLEKQQIMCLAVQCIWSWAFEGYGLVTSNLSKLRISICTLRYIYYTVLCIHIMLKKTVHDVFVGEGPNDWFICPGLEVWFPQHQILTSRGTLKWFVLVFVLCTCR